MLFSQSAESLLEMERMVSLCELHLLGYELAPKA
jgi:hypothetical protein